MEMGTKYMYTVPNLREQERRDNIPEMYKIHTECPSYMQNARSGAINTIIEKKQPTPTPVT
jgi:hypothetical protein